MDQDLSLLDIYLQNSRELTKEDRKIEGKENVRVQDKYLRRCMQQLFSYLHLNE